MAIEPYRASAVPGSVKIIQAEVQEVPVTTYDTLGNNDILFIDSSHVTMPYGDTLMELLTILPRLNPGVIVHILPHCSMTFSSRGITLRTGAPVTTRTKCTRNSGLWP